MEQSTKFITNIYKAIRENLVDEDKLSYLEKTLKTNTRIAEIKFINVVILFVALVSLWFIINNTHMNAVNWLGLEIDLSGYKIIFYFLPVIIIYFYNRIFYYRFQLNLIDISLRTIYRLRFPSLSRGQSENDLMCLLRTPSFMSSRDVHMNDSYSTFFNFCLSVMNLLFTYFLPFFIIYHILHRTYFTKFTFWSFLFISVNSMYIVNTILIIWDIFCIRRDFDESRINFDHVIKELDEKGT